MTQAWFESGGVVEQALIMIVSNFIFVEGLKVFQIYPLVMRYLVSPCVVSQKRKDALWAPPRMLLGDLYAGAVKTVALCLICKSPPHSNVDGSQTSNGLTPLFASCSVTDAPLLPIAYLLTSIAFLTTFWCTKFAVVFWYGEPQC